MSAFAFISAAACYNNEIENPDNPQNPEQSGLRITATMAKTRVNYGNETDAQLLPVWEPNDILFGFYVGGDGQIQNFILTVIGIGTNDGNSTATLGFVEGNENGLANQPVTTPVYLIYTGKNGANSITDADKFTSDGFPVDLTSQDLGRIPVCMSATATIGGTDDAKTLSFDFAYDCAVLKIESLTGIAEDSGLTGNLTLPLSSLTISNLILGGTYSFSNGSFEFTPNDNVTEAKTFDLSGGDWTIDKSGSVGSQSGKKILIAVAPNSNDAEIIVTAEAGAQGQEKTFSYSYGTRSLVSGTCYVAKAKPVVAKTEDGQYFTSVSAAFDHASTLYITAYNTAENNIVTLLRDCGIAGVDASYIPITGCTASIDVDGYKATFDLNGHTLTFAGSSEYINVAKNSKLVITDSKSNSDNPGKIYSNTVDYYDEDDDGNGRDLVWNKGELIIEDAVLWHNQDMCAVVNTDEGILTVNGGKLISAHYTAIYSDGGKIDIYGGFIESRDEYETIRVLDGTVCTISGGVICSRGDSPTIGCRSSSPNISKLTIKWPDGIAPASPSEDLRHEPLIYAAAPNASQYYGYNNVPINAFNADDGQGANTAKVNLQGGYLISNQDLLTFYSGDGGTTNDYYNLDFYNNDVGFYSNKEMITFNGSSNGNKKDFYNKGNGCTIKKGSPPVIVKAESAGSGFKMPLINEDSGDLWYIYK